MIGRLKGTEKKNKTGIGETERKDKNTIIGIDMEW